MSSRLEAPDVEAHQSLDAIRLPTGDADVWPENVYSRFLARMQTFVMPENQVNVASIAVFGY
jgi:hypothetical protein